MHLVSAGESNVEKSNSSVTTEVRFKDNSDTLFLAKSIMKKWMN